MRQLFLVLGFSGALFADSIRISIDDIPRLVKEKNRHVEGADLLKKSAQAGKGYLTRSYLPQVKAFAGHEAFKTGSLEAKDEPAAGIDISVNVFRGGRDTLEDRIRDLKADIASFESSKTYLEEVLKARSAFWNLVAHREIYSILEDSIKSNRTDINAALKRIDAGLATDTDKLEFEMYQVELEQELARANLGVKGFELELLVLLGLPDGTQIQSQNVVTHDHNDELLNSTFKAEQNPYLESIKLKSEESLLTEEVARKWWIPSVDFFASHGLETFREREFEQQSDRMESVVGLRVEANIFDGHNSEIEAEQKALEAEGLRAQHSQSLMELKAQVENAKAQLVLNHDLIHKSEEAIRIAGDYLEKTIDEYSKGVKNSPDMLSAREKILDLKLRFVALRKDYQIARAQLISLIGETFSN